jgi:hypothetical protein
MQTSIRASRRRVARSRGALSGFVVLILGLWAGLVPFIGPYFDLAYTPRPNDEWHWTAARGWLEVLPGAAAVLGGLLLIISASRAMTVFGGWLAALAGAWLVIGPPLAPAINVDLGGPDPAHGTNTQAVTALLFFYAVGAAILFFGSLALGRVSVLSVRDVRAAERRAEAEEAERQAALEAATARERERQRAAAEGVRDDGVRGNGVREDGVRDDGVRNDGVRNDGVRDEGVRNDGVGADASGRHAQEPVREAGEPGRGNGPASAPGQSQYTGHYAPAGGPGQPGEHPTTQYPGGQYPTTQYPAGQYPPAPPPREG